MSKLRIRVELNKGRIGIPLAKLARIGEETARFLEMVCEDVGISGEGLNWLATKFDNGSVDFDCEFTPAATEDAIHLGRDAFREVMGNKGEESLIRNATRLQYSRIAQPIDPDERVRFGLYANGEPAPSEWYELTKEIAAKITERIPERITYHGEIQGTVHALYKESREPKLVVRDLASRELVDCFFGQEMYRSAVETLEDPEAVIFVEGAVTENVARAIVECIHVTDFRLAPDFDPASLDEFIGSAPNLTGDVSTEDYVRRFRDEQ